MLPHPILCWFTWDDIWLHLQNGNILNIDVTVVFEKEIFDVGHNVCICVGHSSVVPVCAITVSTPALHQTSLTIKGITILWHFSSGFVIFWEIIPAKFFSHTGKAVIEFTIRAVQHEVDYSLNEWILGCCFVQFLGLFVDKLHLNLFVRNLRADDFVDFFLGQMIASF